MGNDEVFGLGCTLEPPNKDGNNINEILAAPLPVPANFIVPYYRDWFDENFEIIQGKRKVKNQRFRPSCVGQATSYQKEADEGVEISARDTYRQAKRLDGSTNLLEFGTSLSAGQDAVMNGVAAEDIVPEVPDMSLKDYVDIADVNDAVIASRKEHRASKPYFVPRTMMLQTMLQTQRPVVSSTAWYTADDQIGKDGMMGFPTGTFRGGHAIACLGWVTKVGFGKCLVFINSFGINWGRFGFFFVPIDNGTYNRFGNAYISVDMPQDLATVLKKYNKLNVRVSGHAEHYYIAGGQKHRYPDELTWWAFGNLFGYETFEILQAELDVIPSGGDMDINAADFKTRELVRQIRQFYGKV